MNSKKVAKILIGVNGLFLRVLNLAVCYFLGFGGKQIHVKCHF